MGCDIHLHIEVKKNGQWVEHEWESKYNTGQFYQDGTPMVDHFALFEDPLWISRNYMLFAILADVRNRNEVEPISCPRGLPREMSDTVRKRAEYWDLDAHSHSFIYLPGLLDYPWHEKKFDDSGYVGVQEYHKFKTTGETPLSAPGSPRGNQIAVTNKVMNKIDPFVAALEPVDDVHFTYIKWRSSCRDYCSKFVDKFLPIIAALADDPNDVRIVFWFDN